MKLIIDSKEKKFDLPKDIEKLDQLSDIIQKNFILQGRIVTSFIIDNRDILIDENIQDQIDLSKINEILIETTSSCKVAIKKLEIASQHIHKVIPIITHSAQLLRIGKVVEANKQYLNCIDDLNKLILIIVQAQGVIAYTYTSSVLKNTIDENQQQDFIKLLQELVKAQHGKDWITVADLLEYKLIPLLTIWEKIIPKAIGDIGDISLSEE